MMKSRDESRSDTGVSERTGWLPRRTTTRVFVLLATVFLAVGVFCAVASAQETPHPLEPPDTSSPRATITTLIGAMNRAYAMWASGEGRTYKNLAARQAMVKRFARCFDLEDMERDYSDGQAGTKSVPAGRFSRSALGWT